jgi:DNA-binding response OmpR family regulator
MVVIDDNQDAAFALSVLLDRNGFHVENGYDPADPLDPIFRQRPHIAILDIAMPGMDGYELARQIRAAADWPIKLIAVTGLGRACDKADAVEAGFDAHFTKPVAWAELGPLVMRYHAEFEMATSE